VKLTRTRFLFQTVGKRFEPLARRRVTRGTSKLSIRPSVSSSRRV
jgi:hypothetical protein